MATIGGGGGNVIGTENAVYATGTIYSVIAGGSVNTILGRFAAIGGGESNAVVSSLGAIGGGKLNTASGMGR